MAVPPKPRLEPWATHWGDIHLKVGLMGRPALTGVQFQFRASLIGWFKTPFLLSRYIPKGRPPFNSDEKVATIKRGGKAIIALFAMTITFAVLSHQMLHLPAIWGMMFGLAIP